ncbi:MAG: MFS transporter [Erysipelotrichaceae bacterium]|nr:MFS transporter [Erysipelotrichaceae bacterium]
MNETKNYSRTKIACYLGFVTQAIMANFVPLLFLTFRRTYGISYADLAFIPLVFYIMQLLVDLLCAQFVDQIGYRKSIVIAQVASGAGLAMLGFVPDLCPKPFIGILACVSIYAVGSGLIEVLCSPIIEACPFDNKESTMSLLHSFYCWGAVGAIALSTLFFVLFGTQNWRILTCLWALVPLYNVYNFWTCPIEPIVKDGASMSISQLFQTKIFWLFILLMICSGASEASMAQWASAFAESSLGISKTAGDLLGPCGFAVFMGISRVLYSRLGEKADLNRFMILSGILCLCSYLLAAFASLPAMGLAGCMLCGFSVGIMWPGSISISSSKLPKGGTALFAFLALAGDLGAAAGPALVGNISQLLGGNIQAGIAAGLLFPALLVLIVLMLKRNSAYKI